MCPFPWKAARPKTKPAAHIVVVPDPLEDPGWMLRHDRPTEGVATRGLQHRAAAPKSINSSASAATSAVRTKYKRPSKLIRSPCQPSLPRTLTDSTCSRMHFFPSGPQKNLVGAPSFGRSLGRSVSEGASEAQLAVRDNQRG